MKKQLLSGIAVGLILAMMPMTVLGQTSGTNTAVQDYMKAQADYNAAQQELQDAKDDIYWSSAGRQEAESAAQAKVDEMAKKLDTAKAATGMDDYTLNNAVKVETAKNAVNQAKADEQAAKDDWYVFTSRTDAEQKAADNTKAAESNLAKVEQQTAQSNQIKANADAAAAATTESAAAAREQAIRDKVNAQYDAQAKTQAETDQKRADNAAAYQAGKAADQAALDQAAADAKADYEAGNYENNIEQTVVDRENLAAKEKALADAQKGGNAAEIAAAERDLNEAKASTLDSKNAQAAFDNAVEESEKSRKALLDAAGVNAAGKTVSDNEAQAAKEILQEQNTQAQATADGICANEGASSMNCQQAKQSAKEQIDANNKLIQDVENAQKNEEAAYQNYVDTVNKQSSANSQARTEELQSKQAEKSATASKTQALANMRKGAFWEALATVDSTKGDNYIDQQYAGNYQRAFDDSMTYAKELAGKASANLKQAETTLSREQNILTDKLNESTLSKSAANTELESQLDKQLLAQENKVAAAEGAVAAAQQAYDNAKTPAEKAAAKAKLDEAEMNLTEAQIARDEFEKYADLQKQQNQAQQNAAAANIAYEQAKQEADRYTSMDCNGDTACQQRADAAQEKLDVAEANRGLANKKFEDLKNQTADQKNMVDGLLTENEVTNLNNALKANQEAIDKADQAVNDQLKKVNSAYQNTTKAVADQNMLNAVVDGKVSSEEAQKALQDFAKEETIRTQVDIAEKQVDLNKKSADTALEAQKKKESFQEKQQAQNEANAAAVERQKLLSGALFSEAVRDNVTNPITNATKSVTDYVSGGVRDIQTGVGDALYDTYKSITK